MNPTASALLRVPSTVPSLPALTSEQLLRAVQRLTDFLRTRSRVVVITGAGGSTESGLPDYRSPGGSYSKGHKPMMFQTFRNSHEARQRYWTRSFYGWHAFSAAQPNAFHRALADLERKGRVSFLITQNVDDLHEKAGSQRMLKLHGDYHTVLCLGCGGVVSRAFFQKRLADSNPDWAQRVDAFILSKKSAAQEIRPDGDVELFTAEARAVASDFRVPNCDTCNGLLKPNIVFFGENLPPERTAESFDAIRSSDGVLVAGSSLQTLSSLRLVRLAKENAIEFGVVNIGWTRADDQGAVFKIEAHLGPLFQRLNETLC